MGDDNVGARWSVEKTKAFNGSGTRIKPMPGLGGRLARSIPEWSLTTLRDLGLPDDKIGAYFDIWAPKPAVDPIS